MAITTYAQLKVATERWLSGSDDKTATALGIVSTIDDLVTVAESRISRECRTKDTEASIGTAIASGVIAVPADYLGTKYLYIDGSPIQFLEARPPEWIYQNYPSRASDSKPLYYAREASSFIFGPYPDSNYTVRGIYYKKLPALSSGVHNLFSNNPDLYLFATLAESSILIGPDTRIALWEQKYRKILEDVNAFSKNSEYFGPIRMR